MFITFHGTQATWEPEKLHNTCESFKQSLIKIEEHIAAPNKRTSARTR
jgi:hypothetical protein